MLLGRRSWPSLKWRTSSSSFSLAIPYQELTEEFENELIEMYSNCAFVDSLQHHEESGNLHASMDSDSGYSMYKTLDVGKPLSEVGDFHHQRKKFCFMTTLPLTLMTTPVE